MKKFLSLILIIIAIVGIFSIPKSNKEESDKKTDKLEVGSEVKVSLNNDLKLSFYILKITDDNMKLIIKDSLEKIKCEDDVCDNLTNKIEDLKNSWTNANEVRLVKSSDVLSEEDLNVESDSICTRLESYLNPDEDGYYLENVKMNGYGYVKSEGNNCVEINFETIKDKEYSLKPIIIIEKKYIIK